MVWQCKDTRRRGIRVEEVLYETSEKPHLY